MKRAAVTFFALLCAQSAGAHHSYANFDQDKPFVFSGALVEVQWGNPHILLLIDNGTETMRVEWITVPGADRTGVTREQFSVGDQLTVTGSRHRDPDTAIMSLVKELQVPDRDLHWVAPTGLRPPALLEN